MICSEILKALFKLAFYLSPYEVNNSKSKYISLNFYPKFRYAYNLYLLINLPLYVYSI